MIFIEDRLGANAVGNSIVGVVMCVLASLVPTNASAQSLKSELQLLIQTNPRIEEQRAILRRAQEAVTTARAGYYPTISVSASAGGETTSNIARRTTEVEDAILKFNALGLEVRQNLFNGFSTDNSVDSALMARDSVALALESTVQAVMLQGVSAYINVLRLNELIRVGRARERTIREQLNLETERVERGAGIEVDVLQAKSRLQLAIEARVDLEGQLENAAADYIQAFERSPDITQMRLVATPLDLVPSTLDDALYIAREQNPLIVARVFLARSARFTVEAQRAGYMPTVDLVGRFDHEKNVSAVEDHVRKAAVLIELSWDLFSGFATRSAVASANESLLETLAGSDRTLLEVERQVRQAWTKLENTRIRKELLLNAVSIAQEVFVARQKLRAAGKETTLNVLDAENEVFQAEQNLIRADYDTRVAIYELASAMGVMSPAMLGIDAQVIENIDSYFTGPEEVTVPDPMEEVEEYRARLKAIRDPSLAPAPAAVIDPPPAAAAEPAPAALTSSEPATPSAIEPPPAPQSSAPQSLGPDDSESMTASLTNGSNAVSGTAQRLADVLNADNIGADVLNADNIGADDAMPGLQPASGPLQPATAGNLPSDGIAQSGSEKLFSVARQDAMVQGLPPATDPFSSVIPETAGTEVADGGADGGTDGGTENSLAVATDERVASAAPKSVVSVALPSTDTVGEIEASAVPATEPTAAVQPAAVQNTFVTGIRQALGLSTDPISTAQAMTDPPEPTTVAAVPVASTDIPTAVAIDMAAASPVNFAPEAVAAVPVTVNAEGAPPTPVSPVGDEVLTSIADLFATADPAVDGTARLAVNRSTPVTTSDSGTVNDTGAMALQPGMPVSVPEAAHDDGALPTPVSPVGDKVVKSIANLFANADPAVDGTARLAARRLTPAATPDFEPMVDTGPGVAQTDPIVSAPERVRAESAPPIPASPVGDKVVKSIANLFANADPAVDGTARLAASRLAPAAKPDSQPMADTGPTATPPAITASTPEAVHADGTPPTPVSPVGDKVVNSIANLFATADPAVDGTARLAVRRPTNATTARIEPMDDIGPGATQSAAIASNPALVNPDGDPVPPVSPVGDTVLTSIADLFATADPAIAGTARPSASQLVPAADSEAEPLADIGPVSPEPVSIETVIPEPMIPEPMISDPSIISAPETVPESAATTEPFVMLPNAPGAVSGATSGVDPVAETQGTGSESTHGAPTAENRAADVPVTVMTLPVAQPVTGADDDKDRDAIVVWNNNDSAAAFDIPGSLLFGGVAQAPR